MRSFFNFPDQVNEAAARVVASIVVVLAVATVVSGTPWPLIPLVYGFWARVLSGPKVSPAALFATRIAAPRLAPQARLVPGPPKRFAQGIGAAFSTTSLVLWFGFGLHVAAVVVVALLAAAAFAESAFGFCLGCQAFALLMRAGVIPERVCVQCAELSLRPAGA